MLSHYDNDPAHDQLHTSSDVFFVHLKRTFSRHLAALLLLKSLNPLFIRESFINVKRLTP